MRLILVALLLSGYGSTFSQSLTGSWYGKADAVLEGSHNNYLTELIIKQKGNEVEGTFGYYFKNGYKSLFIRGRYDSKARKLVISDIPLTYFRSNNIDGVDCMMDFNASIIASKVQTTINGMLTAAPKYTYTCPEMRVIYTLDISEQSQDSLIKNSVARKLWQPLQEDIIINDQPVVAEKMVVSDTVKKSNIAIENLIKSFEQRTTILSKTVDIHSDSVRISFYDNGDIDGDSISVFLNKVPVLSKQRLSANALNIYVKLDPAREINEVSMYAENLGKFPPNTALMVVNDGENRHEVYLSSSLTQNAAVRLRRVRR